MVCAMVCLRPRRVLGGLGDAPPPRARAVGVRGRDERDAVFGNYTLNFTFVLWLVAHATLCIGFMLIRLSNHAYTASDDCTPFYRLPVRELFETRINRTQTVYAGVSNIVMAVLYAAYFILASLTTHTVLAHMYVERNPWFAALLLMQVVFTVVAALDDVEGQFVGGMQQVAAPLLGGMGAPVGRA